MNNIIFDMDGTLIDSAPGIYKAYKEVCVELSLKSVESEEFCKLIGPSIKHIVENIYPTIDKHIIDIFTQRFRKKYDGEYYKHFSEYEGCRELLNNLRNIFKAKLYIVTNKPSISAEKIISIMGHDKIKTFEDVIGIDYLRVKGMGDIFKGKKYSLAYALEKHTLRKECTCYVGDTENDKESAFCNQIRFVGAGYGYGGWKTDKKGEFIEKISDLERILFNKEIIT